MPTFWVMKNNEKKTGVSVFYVDEGIEVVQLLFKQKLKLEIEHNKN